MCSLLPLSVTVAEPLPVRRIDSGPGVVDRMGRPVRAPPWGSSAAQLPMALGQSGVWLLDCPTKAADDEVSWGTSSRYRDLQRPAWPRPHSRLSVVLIPSARHPLTGPEIEDAHLLRLDTARR
jgi:hypothetical protein